jgi:LytR cell envelope-related transcriptional attenuator
MTDVSRPPGGSSGRDAARGAGSAAAKGALLIGLAIIIGVVLLRQVDSDSTKSGASPTVTTKPKAKPKTTTTVKRSTSTTTVAAQPTKAPADLSLIVLNGGAAAGAARAMSTQLTQAHYTNQPKPAGNWTGHDQQGNSVLCKSGLDREAVALSVAVGQGTQVQPMPTPPPPDSSSVDCVVVVGGGGSASTSTTTAATQ